MQSIEQNSCHAPPKISALKTSLKSRVNDKFGELRKYWEEKLQVAEESRFAQQISEFELNQRVGQLEEAYNLQQNEILKHSNDNE